MISSGIEEVETAKVDSKDPGLYIERSVCGVAGEIAWLVAGTPARAGILTGGEFVVAVLDTCTRRDSHDRNRRL